MKKRLDSNCCEGWWSAFWAQCLSVAMLELSIKVSSNPLIEACMHCIKLLSKVCVMQHIEAFAYVCDEAQVY